MSENNRDLPYFVRKQVDRASAELSQRCPQVDWLLKAIGRRVIIQQRVPHPVNNTSLLLPVALLDYQQGHWLLLFRGTQGKWQPVPVSSDRPVSLSSLIEQIAEDRYALFWRQ